ncbi:EamA family transporter [Kitasatospora sp. NPDC096147]|uniref:EamA family transporter n=1 Tax=Kitasatospora sp. NPDC096147 TaxID=3364093 RepID=UPI0038134AE2
MTVHTPARSRAAAPFRHGVLAISAAALAWGVGGAVAAVLMGGAGLGPVAVCAWRFAVAAGCLVLLPAARPSAAGGGRAAALLTGIGLTVGQCAYFGAVRYAGLGLATLITIGAGPVLTSLGAHLLLGERLTTRALAANGLALAGLALLTAAPAAGPRPLLGTGLALLAGAAQSGLTLWARGGGTARASAGAFGTGLAVLLPLALLTEGRLLPSGQHPLPTAAALLFLGTVPTLLAYRWYFAGLATVPGATAAVLVLLEPAAAALIGVVCFGEPFGRPALVGAALLLAAIVGLTRWQE